ncbi:Adenylate and Guanylate cyclase catalytic domain containing protein [Tritrichomonas foetus]|uniref:Adenylate and Guanylate cyclase catalytic domain containing protein n=1 Tax=Tritrichomonas foetus TaxID=1144522 RepID=A0A1J4JBD2_9EUKA|nr:Adenylate and Guanylate cyclase catalytic domain containing protein [Tritrichomonas foetus]|eukprot:OHS96448.1 Adenylate and Guanylate cyclase catalytic domain containing protein [Tritrichomonas foetus]
MDWVNTAGVCEIVSNLGKISISLGLQSQIFLHREENASSSFQKIIIIVYCTAIPLAALLFLIPFFFGYVKMLKELQKILDAITLFPAEVFKEASKPIVPVHDSNDSQEIATPIESKKFMRVSLPIFVVFNSVVTLAAVILLVLLIGNVDKKYVKLNKWLELSSHRSPLVLESIINGYLALIFALIGETNYTTYQYHLFQIGLDAQELYNYHSALLWGSDSSTTCNEFDKELDKIHFEHSCEINLSVNSIHNGYECLSANQLMMLFKKNAYDLEILMRTVSDPKSIGESPEFIQFLHIGLSHLLPKMVEAQEVLADGLNIQSLLLKNRILMINIIAIVVTIIIFIIEIILLYNMQEGFNTLLILIARLPPNSVIKNSALMEIITGTTGANNLLTIFPLNSACKFSRNSIIFIDEFGKIIDNNLITCNTFGYTHEQLYLSSITKIIADNDVFKILEKLPLLKRNECEKIQRLSLIGLSDDGAKINLETLLTYIDVDDVFALLMRDETANIHNKEVSEMAKQKSKELIKEMIPFQLIEQSEKTEHKNVFSVKNSVAICISISNYEEVITSFSGKQVLKNLSSVFNSFDLIREDYPSVTKTKILNNNYQCLSGLFNLESEITNSAFESVSFANECIKTLEEINLTIDSHLLLTIGIHAGGPVTAGQLNNESLVFEVIGEPMNVSVELCDEKLANQIIITDEVYELIKNKNNMRFEEYKEIEISEGVHKNTFTISFIESQVTEPPQ